MKNTSGYLYFLQNSLIFLPKANIYFKTDEIKIVEFYRVHIILTHFLKINYELNIDW